MFTNGEIEELLKVATDTEEYRQALYIYVIRIFISLKIGLAIPPFAESNPFLPSITLMYSQSQILIPLSISTKASHQDEGHRSAQKRPTEFL